MDKQLGFEFVTIYVTDGIGNGTTSVPKSFLCYELDKGLKSDLVLWTSISSFQEFTNKSQRRELNSIYCVGVVV